MVLGALATRDWRPMHHDKDFAVHRNGTQDIFLNTPEPGGLVRALPHRLGRPPRTARPGHLPHERFGLSRRHDVIARRGVDSTEVDEVGCGFATVDVTLSVDGDTKTTCTARIALPRSDADNPWARSGDQWRPSPPS